MELITEFDSSTELRLRWTTELPKWLGNTGSPSFTHRDRRYSFRLSAHLNDVYRLKVVNERAQTLYSPRPFDVRVCMAKESDEYLSQSTASDDSGEYIWGTDIFYLKEHVPGFDVKLPMNFRIVLTSNSRNLSPKRKPRTENKMVQTLPSSQTWRPLKELPDDHNRSQIAENKTVQPLPSSQTCRPLKILSADLQKLMDEGFESDLELRCGQQAIPAHRSILSARSEVFRAMIQSDMREKRSGSIEIQDMEFPVLRHFLGYLYGGTLPELTVELATRLFEAGDKYAVKDLAELCAEFLGEHLTMQNACELLVLADKHNVHEFKKSVIEFILDQEIPKKDPEWSQFCSNHARLGLEVLNQYVFRHA